MDYKSLKYVDELIAIISYIASTMFGYRLLLILFRFKLGLYEKLPKKKLIISIFAMILCVLVANKNFIGYMAKIFEL